MKTQTTSNVREKRSEIDSLGHLVGLRQFQTSGQLSFRKKYIRKTIAIFILRRGGRRKSIFIKFLKTENAHRKRQLIEGVQTTKHTGNVRPFGEIIVYVLTFPQTGSAYVLNDERREINNNT